MFLLLTAINVFSAVILTKNVRLFFLGKQILSTSLIGCTASYTVTSFMVFLSIVINSSFFHYNTSALYYNTTTTNAFVAKILFCFFTLIPLLVYVFIPLEISLSFLSASPYLNVGFLDISSITNFFHQFSAWQFYSLSCFYFKFHHSIFTECLYCLY